ncbi:MAG TPA: TlpA disulfide reductase family protein [Catenuloplanes sp.]
MYLLTAAVVVLAVLLLITLAFVAAMVRRLRDIERRVAGRSEPGGLEVGAQIPPFAARAADGTVVTDSELIGRRSLVAFYGVGCPGCETQLPEFTRRAAALAADAVQVLPVLVTPPNLDDHEPDDGLRERLSGTGRLVAGDDALTVMQAFAAQATPSYYTVGPDGRVTGKGMTLAQTLAEQPA